jgi:hypothetical protein
MTLGWQRLDLTNGVNGSAFQGPKQSAIGLSCEYGILATCAAMACEFLRLTALSTDGFTIHVLGDFLHAMYHT